MTASARIALILALLAAGGARAAPAPFASDPTGWWSQPQTITENRLDPLARRSPNAEQISVPIDNGVDPLLYRLWGLPPLQSQLLREGEIILETWYHPTGSARQAVMRLTLRSDGRAFLQARAGLACCKPAIDRRIDINEEISGQRAGLESSASAPFWRSPRRAAARQGDGAVAGLCTGGAAYDVTLVTTLGARSLHRECDTAQIGEIAPALELSLKAALGRDPRFDAVFQRGADFSAERAAYNALIASGGSLAASEPLP